MGKVYVGNSGGELGVRGWVMALDEDSGKLLWKAYNTGPDKDVLIGAEFKPFYDGAKGKDLGVSTWPPDAWKIGGGNMWGWITYDAELHALYHGTGNPGPWNADAAPGRQQVDRRHLRPRPGDRRGALVLPVLAARRARLRRHQRADPARHAVRRQHAQGAGPPGSQRLRLCHRPHQRPGAVRRPVRAGQFLQGRRSENRPADRQPGQGDQAGRNGAQHLSDRLRRQGLESQQLQSADRADLHPARKHVHGLDEHAGELHRRHALRRRRACT